VLSAKVKFWILFNQVKSIEGKPLQKARQHKINLIHFYVICVVFNQTQRQKDAKYKIDLTKKLRGCVP